jgi:hypothetical protein
VSRSLARHASRNLQVSESAGSGSATLQTSKLIVQVRFSSPAPHHKCQRQLASLALPCVRNFR